MAVTLASQLLCAVILWVAACRALRFECVRTRRYLAVLRSAR